MTKESKILLLILVAALVLLLSTAARHRQASGPAQVYSSVGATPPIRQAKETKAKKARALEREMRVLLKEGNAVGPKHIQRMWNDLLWLWQKGYLTKQKAQELYNLLAEIYWRSNPKSGAKEVSGSVHQIVKETQQEVAGFSKHTLPTKEHYHAIVKKLAWLAEQGVSADELSVIRQHLEQWNPERMVQEVEASRQEARAEQAAREKQAAPHTSEQQSSQQGSGPPSPPGCVSTPHPIFTHHVTDLSRIAQINTPVMRQNSGAVKSHSYLWIASGGEVPVYAPVDSQLVAVSYFEDDYGLAFEVGCGALRWRLGHITNPVDSIRAVLPSQPQGHSRDMYIAPIAFKAGDVIAYTSGTKQAHNWDFGVYDPNRTNGLSVSQPGVSEKDTTARCPYAYYPSEKQAQYSSLFQSAPNAMLLLDLCL